MKLKYRPMALMGFTMLLIFLACVYISSKIAIASIAVGAVLLIISFAFENIRKTVVPFFLSAVLILSGSVFVASSAYNVSDFKNYYDKKCVLSGTIVDEPEYRYSRYYYIIQTKAINNDKIKTKVRISVHDKIDAEIYDYISLKANVYPIGSESEDLRLYYQSKGIFLGAYTYDSDKNILIEQCEKKPLQYVFLQARKTIQSRVIEKLPNDFGGIIVGMLTGSKDFISDKTVSAIKEAGIAPLFAVSGLHFSIWVMGLFSILDLLKINKRINSLINIVFSLAFMALTGFSPSVTRAGIMLIILLVGNLLFRKPDSLNSLGLAVLLICIINPLIISDLGFLLSVTATLGIIIIFPFFNKNIISNLNHNVFEKILASITSVFFVTICALIGTFPVTVLAVGYFSLFTVISNLLVSFVATVCMLFGGLSALFYPISFISDASAFISGLLAKYIYSVLDIISSFKITVISTDNIYWQVGTVLLLICFVFIFLFLNKKIAVKCACVSLGCVIVISSFSYAFLRDNTVNFHLLNESKSLGVVIEEQGHKYVILGNGEFDFLKNDIVDVMNETGFRNNDLLLITDENAMYKYQTVSLIKEKKFNQIVIPISCSSIIDNINGETEITANKVINIELNDLSTVDYINTDDYIIAKCNFDKISILVIYSSDGLTDIPEEYTSADVLIFRDKLPQNVDLNSYNEVIISSDEKTVQSYFENSGNNVVPVLSTANNGDIDIIINYNDYKIVAEVI